MNIKPLGDIAKKWGDVTPGRSGYYDSGIRAPKTDWAGAAAGAESAWQGGVTEAAGRKAFSKGCTAAGTPKWQSKAIAKKDRWGSGVRDATPDYSAGFEPFHRVITGLPQPAAYPRGDPRNYDIVKTIGDALHRARIGGS